MQIINKTPWDTEGLTALVTMMGDSLPNLEKVTFINHQPQPGVKREKQDIYEGSEPYNYNSPPKNEARIEELCFELLTPKRVKARTSALDRLAYAKDLKAHQVPLPVSVIEKIVHSLHQASKVNTIDRWNRREHLRGKCECDKTLPESPIIAGDTRVKTRPPITVAQLQRKLYYANTLVKRCQTDLDDATEKASRLRDRIESKKAREAKEQAKLDRIRRQGSKVR